MRMFYNYNIQYRILGENFDRARSKKLLLFIFVPLFLFASVCIVAYAMRGPALELNVDVRCLIDKSRLAQDHYLIMRFPENDQFIPLPTWVEISVHEKFLFIHIEHAKVERRFVDEDGEYRFDAIEIYNDNNFRPWFFGSDVFVRANYACMSPNKTESVCLIKQTIHMNRWIVYGRVYAKMFNSMFGQEMGEIQETTTFCV